MPPTTCLYALPAGLRGGLRPERDGGEKDCDEDQGLQALSVAFWRESGRRETELIVQVNKPLEMKAEESVRL